MSKALITEQYLTDIADAIRAQLGVATEYKPSEMAAAIASISGGGGVTVESLSVTANGTYTAPAGKAYSPVVVNVGGGGSQNDLLFHFNDGYGNAGHGQAVFCNNTGLTISDEQSKFGGYSLKCGSTQAFYNIATPYNFDLGSADFTLDFWIYPTNLVSGSTFKVPLACNYRSIAFYLSQTIIEFGLSKTGSSWFNVADIPTSIANNQWHHIALVRDGTDIYGFVNGTKLQTINFGSDAIAPMSMISVGSNTYSAGDRRFQGYIDELRLIKGTAVWTDDFTPPTQPYE